MKKFKTNLLLLKIKSFSKKICGVGISLSSSVRKIGKDRNFNNKFDNKYFKLGA